MNKSKKTTTKIISGMILFLFIISLFSFALPSQTKAETNLSNLYNNPNQTNNNAYKFKISDVVNSNLLTNVVGCTGVVNKVSTWMINFIQSPGKADKMIAKKVADTKKLLQTACKATKAGVQGAVGVIPQVNDLVSPLNTSLEEWCPEKIEAIDDEVVIALMDASEEATEKKIKEQCFDGIAITLAKNQLTAMTRSAMNWVNTGYGGNSFFVKDMIGLANNIERNVLETGIDILLAPNGNQNPYAKNFVESTVYGRNLISSSTNFLGNLQSDLGSFISDPKSYYSDGQLNKAADTRTALQRAQEANDVFANNFSSGGWDAYLALTQRDQNNPLGFTMVASQYLADQQVAQVAQTESELDRNNGFLNQKECNLWELRDEAGNPKYPSSVASGIAGNTARIQSFLPLKSPTKTSDFDKCIGWKVTTPGSIIKDKVTNYLNSPERQLELADTINESLNALFSILISKLEQGGLSGLSDSVENTSNWEDTTNEYISADGNTTYDNGGAYNDFNLTRDLGNTYIYDNIVKLGSWNAKTNIATNTKYPLFPKSNTTNTIQLYPNIVPENYEKPEGAEIKIVYPINGYYTVTAAGKTKIISEGYNNWEVGDRAFWNGSEWQNWRCGTLNDGKCTNQVNPIKKSGVVQIQNDYILGAREILSVLSGVMPNLGKLDYCLPGPNPSYETNSTDAQSAYQDWIGSMYVGMTDSTGLRHGVKIDTEGGRTYDNLKAIYKDNPNVWEIIKGDVTPNRGMSDLIEQFSNICNDDLIWFTTKEKNEESKNCQGNYFFAKDLSNKDTDHLNEKKDIMNSVQGYVNNKMFTNFYSTFNLEMNKKYFKNMTSFYISEPNETSAQVKNSSYVPMAEAGFDLTKNILYYNDDVEKAKVDYNNAISQARVNIAKLEPIKSEVSGIIKTAQDRRNKELVTTLGLTLEQIKAKYKTCFEEENIQFYDADKITAMGNSNEENCSDGIDNDLDGLVDTKDSDCSGNTGSGTRTGRTSADNGATNASGSCFMDETTTTESTYAEIARMTIITIDSDTCNIENKDETSCKNAAYYSKTTLPHGTNYKIVRCKWVAGTGSTTGSNVNGVTGTDNRSGSTGQNEGDQR